MATHLKEGKPETLHDLAERAETYLEAHSSDILFGIDPRFSKIPGSPQRSLPPKRCHNCGSTSHLTNLCPKPQTSTSPKNPRAPQPQFPPRPVLFQRQPSYGGFKPTSHPREPPRCLCTRLNTLLDTADRSSPQQWSINIRVITGPHHNRSTSGRKATRKTITLPSFENLI